VKTMQDEPFNIHCLINTYNDHVTLPLALDSVRDSVDSIIVADGAYKKYYQMYKKADKTAKPWSTDGTLQLLKVLQRNLPPIKLIECPDGKPWQNQVVKRTALLDAVPDKDWFLVLDCDEMFFGNVKEGVYEIMESGCIAGFCPLYNVGLNVGGLYPFWHPRVFLKLPGMHYERKHWLLCDFAHRTIEKSYPVWGTNRFVLAHFKVFRNMRRLAPHMSYMLDMSKSGWQEPQSRMFSEELEMEEREVN
jgi:hypothetical protein